jgi:hypothetical protein
MRASKRELVIGSCKRTPPAKTPKSDVRKENDASREAG